MAQTQAFFAQKYFPIQASSSGVNQIIAGQAGYKIRILNYVIVASGAVNVKWQSGSTDVTGLLYLAANGGVSAPYANDGHFATANGDDLNLNLSGATAVGGHVTVAIYPATVAS